MLARAVSISFVVVCMVYVYTATGLSFGSLSSPKAGFVPMIAGCSALALATINMFRTVLYQGGQRIESTRVGQVVLLVVGLVGIQILFQLVGFAIATFVGMVFLLKVSGTKGWITPIVIAGVLAGGLYVVFSILLKVPLP